jgi:hypothetical protein
VIVEISLFLSGISEFQTENSSVEPFFNNPYLYSVDNLMVTRRGHKSTPNLISCG